MRAIAMEPAYYRDRRLRPGDEFEFVETDGRLGEGGLRYLPEWARAATDTTRAVFVARRDAAAKKFLDAAIHASGAWRGSRKKTFTQAMHEGRGPQQGDPKVAAAAAIAASGSVGAAQKKAALKLAESEGRGPQLDRDQAGAR